MGSRPVNGLTERQRDVLALVARGLSNREVGGELGITEDGVKAHLSRLFLRFGVTNRVELLAATAGLAGADLGPRAPLGSLRAIAVRTGTQMAALEVSMAGISPAARLAAARQALAEVDVALGLVSDLPPDTTGPVIDALRRRLATATSALDDAWRVMHAVTTA